VPPRREDMNARLAITASRALVAGRSAHYPRHESAVALNAA
jgi:hypothetical protein